MSSHTLSDKATFAEKIKILIEHLDHILPSQAPLRDFVHHNTLHGFQHLPFEQATKAAFEATGKYAYIPLEDYRKHYQIGRISAEDLRAVLDKQKDLNASQLFGDFRQGEVFLRDIYRVALLYPLDTISACQLNWQIEENAALTRFQPDVSLETKQNLLMMVDNDAHEADEATVVEGLWESCLSILGLSHYIIHPEYLQELSAEILDDLLEKNTLNTDELNQRLAARSKLERGRLFTRVGADLTLSSLIQALTGKDVKADFDAIFIRHVSAWLDQGVSAWQVKDSQLGFYQVWRQTAKTDLVGVFDDMPEWADYLDTLPEDAEKTLEIMLARIGVKKDNQIQYLENLASDLSGWGGMFLWRSNHKAYQGLDTLVDMRDYLAVRLVMEYFYCRRVCETTWLIDANLSDLNGYFQHNHAEFLGRFQLFNQHLPEYLVTGLQNLLVRTTLEDPHQSDWQGLTQMIWIWQHSPASANNNSDYSIYHSAWRLFRLAQHIGWCSHDIECLKSEQIEGIFASLAKVADTHVSGFIWLQAYERHFRDIIFNAISYQHQYQSNKTVINWADRNTRPQAQLIFCIDDREEAIRRHLEELAPNIETFGVAAFFNLVINWRGLDDTDDTPLCPVVQIPVHRVEEQAHSECDTQYQQHVERRNKRLWMTNLWHQESRRNPFIALPLTMLSLPISMGLLLGKMLAPLKFGRLYQRLQQGWDVVVPTQVNVNATTTTSEPSIEHNQLGFTDQEQADRVAGFLRNIGLVHQFSPLVLLVGHGSSSLNNPHLAAYDCGACSGRHSGPNARAFATMANRPIIRKMVAERGIKIPDDCWFLGTIHNTANESFEWFDTDLIPEALQVPFEQLKTLCDQGSRYSAHERCRKFASAPLNLDTFKAHNHSVSRSLDFSQVRPELGHSTNALAFIGRRSFNRGLFFDRRAFLVSYDYRIDPDGTILENTLLNGGPVVAGINLEYYFSCVNNEEYGCGQKTLHNLTGLFGVMEGASSDLRTGLPWQMLDIHEPMRLQVMVEVKVDTMIAIYQRQPDLQELVGNGWLLFSVKDPESQKIFVFEPDQGFVLWEGTAEDLTQVERSADWYQGTREHLMPALVTAAMPGESA